MFDSLKRQWFRSKKVRLKQILLRMTNDSEININYGERVDGQQQMIFSNEARDNEALGAWVKRDQIPQNLAKCDKLMKVVNAITSLLLKQMLTIPISGGKPDKELLDKSRTERRNLHASAGYSFNCIQVK